MISVVGRDRGAAPGGFFDALLGEHRAFDLHEMHLGRRGDAGILDGGGDGLGGGPNLWLATDLFWGERAGEADADGEALAGGRRRYWLAAEDEKMW